MASTQNKLATYIGIERPALLEVTGRQPDDPIALDLLWEQFAQMATSVTEGKTLEFVTEFPEEGNENIIYALTKNIDPKPFPIETPVAGEGFTAKLDEERFDISAFALGNPVTGTIELARFGITVDFESQVLNAVDVLANVTSGGKVWHLYEHSNSEHLTTALYFDEEVVADGQTYPSGFYGTFDAPANLGNYNIHPLNASEVFENSIGVYALSQEAIDAGFQNLLMGESEGINRGFYSFDGENYNIEIDLNETSNILIGTEEKPINLDKIIKTGNYIVRGYIVPESAPSAVQNWLTDDGQITGGLLLDVSFVENGTVTDKEEPIHFNVVSQSIQAIQWSVLTDAQKEDLSVAKFSRAMVLVSGIIVMGQEWIKGDWITQHTIVPGGFGPIGDEVPNAAICVNWEYNDMAENFQSILGNATQFYFKTSPNLSQNSDAFEISEDVSWNGNEAHIVFDTIANLDLETKLGATFDNTAKKVLQIELLNGNTYYYIPSNVGDDSLQINGDFVVLNQWYIDGLTYESRTPQEQLYGNYNQDEKLAIIFSEVPPYFAAVPGVYYYSIHSGWTLIATVENNRILDSLVDIYSHDQHYKRNVIYYLKNEQTIEYPLRLVEPIDIAGDISGYINLNMGNSSPVDDDYNAAFSIPAILTLKGEEQPCLFGSILFNDLIDQTGVDSSNKLPSPDGDIYGVYTFTLEDKIVFRQGEQWKVIDTTQSPATIEDIAEEDFGWETKITVLVTNRSERVDWALRRIVIKGDRPGNARTDTLKGFVSWDGQYWNSLGTADSVDLTDEIAALDTRVTALENSIPTFEGKTVDFVTEFPVEANKNIYYGLKEEKISEIETLAPLADVAFEAFFLEAPDLSTFTLGEYITVKNNLDTPNEASMSVLVNSASTALANVTVGLDSRFLHIVNRNLGYLNAEVVSNGTTYPAGWYHVEGDYAEDLGNLVLTATDYITSVKSVTTGAYVLSQGVIDAGYASLLKGFVKLNRGIYSYNGIDFNLEFDLTDFSNKTELLETRIETIESKLPTLLEGKIVEFVTEFPAEGNVDIAYGLTTPIDSERGPVTNPVAGVAFKAFFRESVDLSSLTMGQTGTIALVAEKLPPGLIVDMEAEVFNASSVLPNVTSGLNSKILHIIQTINSNQVDITLYIGNNDGTIIADPSETQYDAGWYHVVDGTFGNYTIEAVSTDTGTMEGDSTGLWTLDQNAIDMGFSNVLMGFTDNFVSGFYSFNGTEYVLEINSTDYSGDITLIQNQISNLEEKVENISLNGKTVEVVNIFPAEGDDGVLYALTQVIKTEIVPASPIADVEFKGFTTATPDISSIVVGELFSAQFRPERDPLLLLNIIGKVSTANSVFSNLTSGEDVKVFTEAAIEENGGGYVYLSDEVIIDGVVCSAGWYWGSKARAFLQNGDIISVSDLYPRNNNVFEEESVGVYTFPQSTIDAGYSVLLMTFNDHFARGLYSFDGTSYKLEMDLTDFSENIENIETNIFDLEQRVNALESSVPALDGKTIQTITEFPETGNENIAYFLTETIYEGVATTPIVTANVPFNGFLIDAPDLSSFVLDVPVTVYVKDPVTDVLVYRTALTVSLASSLLGDTSGGNARFFSVVDSNGDISGYLDAEITTLSGTYPAGWYVGLNSSPIEIFSIPYEGAINGVKTLVFSQGAIDAGYASLVKSYAILRNRGVYLFDGTSYVLAMDLTDYSDIINFISLQATSLETRADMFNTDFEERIAALEAWMAEVELAAEDANSSI